MTTQNTLSLVLKHQDWEGVDIINRIVGDIGYSGTLGKFTNGVLTTTGATAVAFPPGLTNAVQVYVKNTSASGNITLRGTPVSATGSSVILATLAPDAVALPLWSPISGASGYTALSLTANVIGCTFESFVGGGGVGSVVVPWSQTSPIMAYDVTAFGSVGDGVGDDTAFIQAAFDAAVNGVVWLPGGTYKITDTLTVAATQLVRILGTGATSTILSWAGGNSKPMIQVDSSGSTNTQDFEISHLDCYNGNSATGLVGVQFNSLAGSSNRNAIRLQNVVFQNCAQGIALYGGIEEVIIEQCGWFAGITGIYQAPNNAGQGVQNLDLRNNNFRELTGWALDFGQGTGAVCQSNIVQSESVTAAGFRFDKFGAVLVQGNQFGMAHNAGLAAIYLGRTALGTQNISGAVVQANQIASGKGIVVDYAKGVAIRGNSFYNSGPCIHLTTHAAKVEIGQQQFGTLATPTLQDDGCVGLVIMDETLGYSINGIPL